MAGQGFDRSFQRDLLIEPWTFYSIGTLMIVVRAIARWQRVLSLSYFAVDDWLMSIAVPIFYTGLIVCLNLIAEGGGSNLLSPGQSPAFTPQENKKRIKGSMIVVVSEQACMLLMFARMTSGTTHIRRIKFLAIYIAVGWIAVQIAFFTTCIPFHGFWSVSPSNPQCTTFRYFAIIQAAFNLSSDVLIIAVPVPMILSLSLPTKQKIGLGVLFSMGTFVIIAAVLTKFYNLSDVYNTSYMLWYTREASVAVYVANLPGIWPLLREHMRFKHGHNKPNATEKYPLPHYGHESQSGDLLKHQCSRMRITIDEMEPDKTELKDSYNKCAIQPLCPPQAHLNGGNLGVVSSNKNIESNERVPTKTRSWKGVVVMEA